MSHMKKFIALFLLYFSAYLNADVQLSTTDIWGRVSNWGFDINSNTNIVDAASYANAWANANPNLKFFTDNIRSYFANQANSSQEFDRAPFDLSVSANKNEFLGALALLQVFVKNLQEFGSADNQAFVDITQNTAQKLDVLDSLYGITYGMRLFLEVSISKGALITNTANGTNEFGNQPYSVDLKNDLFNALIILRTLFFSTYYSLNLNNSSDMAKSQGFYNTISTVTLGFERKGLLAQGFNIDNILSSTSQTPLEISKSLQISLSRNNVGKILSVNSAGVVTTASSFGYLEDQVFSILYLPSTGAFYLKSPGLGKVLGNFSANSGLTTINQNTVVGNVSWLDVSAISTAPTMSTVLLPVFASAWGSAYGNSTNDSLQTLPISSLQMNLKNILSPSTILEKLSILQASSSSLSITTSNDLLLVGNALLAMLDSLKNNIVDLGVFDQNIQTFLDSVFAIKLKFSSLWTSDPSGAAIQSIWGQKALLTDTPQEQISKFMQTASSNTTTANTTLLFNQISSLRNFFNLPYSLQVNNLVARFNSKITLPNQFYLFFQDLEALTSLTPTTTIQDGTTLNLSSMGSLVQAFPEDINIIRNQILTPIVYNSVYKNLDNASVKLFNNRLSVIIKNLQKVITVEEYLQDLQNMISGITTLFNSDQQTLFLQKLDRILSFRSSAKNVDNLLNQVVNIINSVRYNQMKGQDDALNSRLSSVGTTVQAGIFIQKKQALYDLAANLGPSNINDFLSMIADIVAIRSEANRSDLAEIYNYLQSTDLLSKNVIFFDSTGNYTAKLKSYAQQLMQPIPFSQRVDNLRLFIQNNVGSNFTSLVNNQLTLNEALFRTTFLTPILEKSEWLIFEKDSAQLADLQNVVALMEYARRNQFALALGLNLSFGDSTIPLMFQGKTVSTAIDTIVAQLQVPAPGTDTIVGKTSILLATLKNLALQDRDGARTVVEIELPRLLAQKMDASQSDLQSILSLLDAVRWNAAIKSYTYSTSFPTPGQKDQKIAVILDQSFIPYLQQAPSFNDYLDSLKNLASNQPLTNQQKAIFISRAQNMANLVGQIQSAAQFADALSFFNTAKYNYMSQFGTNIDVLIKKINDAQTVWVASQQESTIPNFSQMFSQFQQNFVALNDSNYTTSLNFLNTELGNLATAKKYALASDLASAVSFVSSTNFTTNPIMLYRKGLDLLKQNIGALTKPLDFLSQYQAMQSLIKIIMTDKTAKMDVNGNSISAWTVKDVSDYRVLLLKEKLVLFVNSSADIYNNKINLQDTFVLFDSMKMLEKDVDPNRVGIYNFLSNVDGVYDSFETLKQKIQIGILGQEQANLAFVDKVAKLGTMLSSMNVAVDAIAFYNYAQAMLDRKVEASPADISNFVATISKAYYSSNFIQLYNSAKNINNSDSLLNNLTTKITTAISNLDRINWLLLILSSQTLTQEQQNLVMRVLNDFMQNNIDGSGNGQLLNLINVLQKAMYTNLSSQQAKIPQIVSVLQDMASKISIVKVSADVQALQARIDTLQSYDLRQFLIDLQIQVNKRLDLSGDDNTQLTNLLVTLQNKYVFTSQKSASFGNVAGTVVTYDQFLTNLLTTMKTSPTFIDRLNNLQKFYNNLRTNGVLDEDKKVFMDKVQRLIAVKADNLVRYEDDPNYDKIFALINLLNQAAYDLLKDLQSDLLNIVNTLVAYRQGVQKNLTPMFSTRISQFQAMLANLQNLNDAQSFVSTLQGLNRDKVQGTALQINSLINWLKTNNVTTNPVLFRANVGNTISTVIADLNNPNNVDLNNRYLELQRMINVYAQFSPEQRIEFFEKLQFLIESFISAATTDSKPSAPTKGQLLDIIFYAKQNLFTNVSESYSTNSVGGHASKINIILNNTSTLLDKFSPILDAWSAAVNALSLDVVAKSFAQRLIDLHSTYDTFDSGSNVYKYDFAGVVDSNAQQFVQTLKSMISSLVDAVKTDLDEMQKILTSLGLRTNASIFSLFGGFGILDQMLSDSQKPILFTDRAINMKNFVTNVILPSTTLTQDQKTLFVNKAVILFQERWRAASENIDLSVLRDLLNMVTTKKFDSVLDRTLVSQLVSIINDFLTPAQAPITSKVNYDFSIDDQSLRANFKKLTSTTFDAFIKQINEISSRRVNAVYLTDDASENQAEILRNWLLSNDVMLNEVVYNKLGNQDKVAAAANALIAPISYNDLYTNLYNFVTSNQTFDTNSKNLCLRKIQRFIKMKNQAYKENYDLNKVFQLFEFIQDNRVNFDSSAVAEITNRIAELKSQGVGLIGFDAQFNDFKNSYFGGKDSTDPAFALTFDSNRSVETFVAALNQLSSNKANSLKEELDALNAMLATSVVINNPAIFFNQTLKNQVSNLIAQLSIPPTYSELGADLQSMISNKASFTDDDKVRFKTKLRRLVDSRVDGYSSGYDMQGLADWVNYTLTNQMTGDGDVKVMRDALLIKPKGATKNQPYINFADRLNSQKIAFAQFTNSPADKSKVEAWLNALQGLVNQRVDGYNFNQDTGLDDNSPIKEFIDFLDNTVRYNYFIYHKPTADNPTIEQKVDNYLLQLNAQVTIDDLIKNLSDFSSTISLFDANTKSILDSKIARIINRRGEASVAQKSQIKGLLKYMRINQFQPVADGDFLLDRVTALDKAISTTQSSSGVIDTAQTLNETVLRGAVEGLEAEDSSITTLNVGSRQDVENVSTRNKINTVLGAFVSQVQFKNNATFQSYLSRARISANSILNKLQSSLTSSEKLELAAILNKFMALVVSTTSTSSTNNQLTTDTVSTTTPLVSQASS